jgi:hypothetical protein
MARAAAQQTIPGLHAAVRDVGTRIDVEAPEPLAPAGAADGRRDRHNIRVHCRRADAAVEFDRSFAGT